MTESNNRLAANLERSQNAIDDETWAFNAANAALVGDFPFDLSGGGPTVVPNLAPEGHQQIVFIEGNVPDARQFAARVTPGTLAVILNPAEDGMDQIAALLTTHAISKLAAIDIVAHGADGSVNLGTGTLSAATLAQYAAQLAAIGGALVPGGDLQINGCDVAQDAAGVAFLDALSAAAGGANVAAASHLVGAASGGGSWDLDVDTGPIDVGSPFTAAGEGSVQGELSLPTGELFATGVDNNLFGQIVLESVITSGTVPGTTTTLLAGTTTGYQPFGISVDAPQDSFFESIYNNTDASFAIEEVNISTKASTTLVDLPGSDDAFIESVAYDPDNGLVYFTTNTPTLYPTLNDGFRRGFQACGASNLSGIMLGY